MLLEMLVQAIRKAESDSDLSDKLQIALQYRDSKDENIINELPMVFYELARHRCLALGDLIMILNMYPPVGMRLLSDEYRTQDPDFVNLIISLCAPNVIHPEGKLIYPDFFYRLLHRKLPPDTIDLFAVRLAKSPYFARHVLSLARNNKEMYSRTKGLIRSFADSVPDRMRVKIERALEGIGEVDCLQVQQNREPA
jgi:hypothetical protein